MRATWIIAVLCGGCIGGGGGGGSDAGAGVGAGAIGQTPEQKCDRLAGSICARLQECGEMIMGPAPAGFQDDCIAQFDCARTTSVGSDYDECARDLDTEPCSTFFPASGGAAGLPASCSGVLNAE